jgi:hypothetical protein
MNAIPDVIFHFPGRFAPGTFFMAFKNAKNGAGKAVEE